MQLLAGAQVEEVLVQVVLVVGVQEVFYDSSTGLEMRSVLAVFSTLEKDALRCNHCGFSSLGCERAGYGSREDGQYECQYQSDCQSAYCPAETMNQAVLCFQRLRGFDLVCIMTVKDFFRLPAFGTGWMSRFGGCRPRDSNFLHLWFRSFALGKVPRGQDWQSSIHSDRG